MKKFILSIIFGIGILFSMSSCAVGAYAQDEVYYESIDGDVDINIVIRYGTPYYYDGSILYYSYNGWYYYPYYLNNSYYYYRYTRPLPPPRYGHRFVPRRGDRPYYGGYRHHKYSRVDGHRGHGGVRPSRPNVSPRVNGGHRSGSVPRISGGGSMWSHGGGSRSSMGGGHRYGGRR
jgi:hypothetical protein